MKIIIGSDHAAYDLVDEIVLKYNEIDFINVNYTKDSTDYPDVAKNLVDNYRQCEANYIISICGTGFGITNSVIKYSKLDGYIFKNEDHLRYLKNSKVIGFGARTTNVELLHKIIERIVNEYN